MIALIVLVMALFYFWGDEGIRGARCLIAGHMCPPPTTDVSTRPLPPSDPPATEGESTGEGEDRPNPTSTPIPPESTEPLPQRPVYRASIAKLGSLKLPFRVAPGTTAATIVDIPAGAGGISMTGKTAYVQATSWCEVIYRQRTGWVSCHYLEPLQG